jgi:hypothetical protein
LEGTVRTLRRDIMIKVSLFLSVVVVLAAFCVPAQAATIQGRVLEAELPHNGLTGDGGVSLSRKNGTNWDYVSSASVDETSTTFLFEGLTAGTYSLRISGESYVTEYYNNTTRYQDRTEITVAAGDTWDAGDIYLRHVPFRLVNANLSSHEVPVAGGTIRAHVDVVNDGTTAQTFLLRAMLNSMRTVSNATYIAGNLQGGSRSVTVPAHSTVTTTVAITIPASAEPGVSYHVRLQLGVDKWRPLSNPVYAGYIAKLRRTDL